MTSEVDADHYRTVVGRFATGVTLLTTVTPSGQHHGMTANAFTSVSLDPVLVLVCVERVARFHEAVLEAGAWGLSVLAADQEHLSRHFARRGRPLSAEQFDLAPHFLGAATGCVLLSGALATLECRTVSTHDGGDHTVVIGEVLSLDTPRADHDPLVFFDGAYRSLSPGSTTSPAPATTDRNARP